MRIQWLIGEIIKELKEMIRRNVVIRKKLKEMIVHAEHDEKYMLNMMKNMLMIVSPNGRCYLVDMLSSTIIWYVETKKRALYLVNRGDKAVEYLDLKPQDPDKIDWSENNMNFYHFKPDTQPELIPLVTADAEEIQRYVDRHYNDTHTTVNQTKDVYHFNYTTGALVNSSPDAFKIERVDFYINRPGWSLKIARIRAWFPPYFNQKSPGKCEVYHSRNSQKYIQVCNEFNLHPLPADSFLNKLIINNNKNMSDLVTINRKIQIDHKFAEGKHDICILRGTWDGRDAIVKKVKRRNNLEETKYMIRMIQMSGYHENLVNFYRWETDGEFEYFAFEVCGVTLHEYVKQHTYKEMSETTLKIMSGLAEDGQIRDLHNLAHIILHIILNGQHDVKDVDVVPETFNDRILDRKYISSLQLQGTIEEALDLFEKLGILSGSQKSDHLKEGKPTQQLLTDLQKSPLGGCSIWFLVPAGVDVNVNVAVEQTEQSDSPDSAVSSQDSPQISEPTSTVDKTKQRSRPVRKSDMPPVKDEELVPGASFTGKLSDGYVKDVANVVSVGQEVKVKLVEENIETGRIALTMRENESASGGDSSRPPRKTGQGSGPRRNEGRKTTKFVKGQDLDGTVKNLTRSGAFINLPEGEEGFLPQSEEADEGFGSLMGDGSSLEVGQEVKVRVLKIARGQVTLTMKKDEDAKAFDSKLQGKVFTATNPFLVAFRQNKDIASFLDEREKVEEPTVDEKVEAEVEISAEAETQASVEETEVASPEPEEVEKVEPVCNEEVKPEETSSITGSSEQVDAPVVEENVVEGWNSCSSATKVASEEQVEVPEATSEEQVEVPEATSEEQVSVEQVVEEIVVEETQVEEAVENKAEETEPKVEVDAVTPVEDQKVEVEAVTPVAETAATKGL
ncbi:nucleic acid-binding, OB-fold protein [Tanacetum coccineum]